MVKYFAKGSGLWQKNNNPGDKPQAAVRETGSSLQGEVSFPRSGRVSEGCLRRQGRRASPGVRRQAGVAEGQRSHAALVRRSGTSV